MIYIGKIKSRVTENTVYQETNMKFKHISMSDHREGQTLKFLMEVQIEH